MPTLIFSLLSSKYTWYALGIIALVAGFFFYRAHLISTGEAEARAAQAAADAAFVAQKEKQLSDLQTYWAPYAAALDQSEKSRNAIIAKLPALAGNGSCLPQSVVQQLQSIGQQPANKNRPTVLRGSTASGANR